MTKNLIIAAAIAAFATPAAAQTLPAMPEVVWPEFELSVGAERALEAEVNTLYSSVGIGAITLGTTMEDTAADTGAFEISKYEFDVVQPLGSHVSLYVKNDFNDEFKHTETVVGGKISF